MTRKMKRYLTIYLRLDQKRNSKAVGVRRIQGTRVRKNQQLLAPLEELSSLSRL